MRVVKSPTQVCTVCEERPTAPNTKTGRCKRCNSNLSAWARRKPEERIQRRDRLFLYTKRIKMVIASKGDKDRK